MARPVGVVVSIAPGKQSEFTPRFAQATAQPVKLSEKSGSVSPRSSFFKHWSRAGRFAIAPDGSSVKRVLHPARFTAVCRMGGVLVFREDADVAVFHTPHLSIAGLLLVTGHVFTQHGVDERLPTAALLPVGGKHIRVKADRLIHLAGCLRGAAPAAPKQFFCCLRADESRQHFSRRAGFGHILSRPFGIVCV